MEVLDKQIEIQEKNYGNGEVDNNNSDNRLDQRLLFLNILIIQ